MRWNYQKKNDERKVSSESINLLSRPSEKPWFSLFELAIFEKLDFELYLIKSVHRDLRFSIFLVFTKNGPLRRLPDNCLCYDQLVIYILATLCAIFMTIVSKVWRPQWFEVGQSASANLIFGQIWHFDHERSPLELSNSYEILFSIQNYIFGHIFRAIKSYLRSLKFLPDLRQHDDHPNFKKS